MGRQRVARGIDQGGGRLGRTKLAGHRTRQEGRQLARALARARHGFRCGAEKNLWERFDSVCTTAYAPAAAHFKQLAEQRQENAGKARMLIAELVKYADDHKLSATVDADPDPDSSSFDWKGIAAYCQQYSQAWHQVGPLDRKEKKDSASGV
ncbi:DUF349 domain-containing protein [Undibacterium arcticum]